MDENNGFFQNPIVKKVLKFVGFVAAYVALSLYLWRYLPQDNHVSDIIMDVFILVLGMILWMIFFAQFVLPVTRIQDRGKVIDRLVTYLMRRHGPAIFIENGFLRTHETETGRKGPGVI